MYCTAISSFGPAVTPDTPLVQQIRTASRLMVRELDFTSTMLATTHYLPSTAHTLPEVSMRGEMTAAQLITLLGLEKSGVSRMVSRLLAVGELGERPCAKDAHAKSLVLTAKGYDTMAKTSAWGARQVVEVLDHLDETQQHTVVTRLTAYVRALAQCRDGALVNTAPQTSLMIGYQLGMIGRVAQMHGGYHARYHDFNTSFEGKVADGVAEFAIRLSSPANQIRLAIHKGKIVSSLAINGEDLGRQEAHLHQFILDDSCRGSGIDRRLPGEAITFCGGRQSSAVQLRTFKGLDVVHKLYKSFGFMLAREWQEEQRGKAMTEWQFTRSGNVDYGCDALAGGGTQRLCQLVRQADNLFLPPCLQ